MACKGVARCLRCEYSQWRGLRTEEFRNQSREKQPAPFYTWFGDQVALKDLAASTRPPHTLAKDRCSSSQTPKQNNGECFKWQLSDIVYIVQEFRSDVFFNIVRVKITPAEICNMRGPDNVLDIDLQIDLVTLRHVIYVVSRPLCTCGVKIKYPSHESASDSSSEPYYDAYPTASGMHLFLMCRRLETTKQHITYPFDLATPVSSTCKCFRWRTPIIAILPDRRHCEAL